MSTTTDGLVTVDLEEIMQILPHRGPMLFVDSARVDPAKAIGEGSWYVRPDHLILADYFPMMPTFPGYLTVEMATQVAIIVCAKSSGFGVKGVLQLCLTHLLVAFKRPVRSGDRLVASLLLERDGHAVVAKFDCYVNERDCAAHGEIVIANFQGWRERLRPSDSSPDDG